MHLESTRVKLPETGAYLCRLLRPLASQVPGLGLVFVIDGQAEVKIRGAAYRLAKADILLLQRCELVNLLPSAANSKEENFLLILKISPDFLSLAFDEGIPVFACGPISPHGGVLEILAEIAYYNGAGAAPASPGKSLLFKSRLFRLLDELKRGFTLEEKEEPVQKNDAMNRDRLIASYMARNFRYSTTLKALSKKFSLSPQYLSRYFKNRFGVNFHSYLNRLRLESAQKDLLLSNATVTTVAHDNGFPSLSTFTRELKNASGKTPNEYRKAADTQMRETEIDYAETVPEKEEIQNKLLAYLHNIQGDNPENQQRKIIEADVRFSSGYERPWAEVINLGFARDFLKPTFLDHLRLIQTEAPFRYGRLQGIFGKSMLISQNDKRSYNFVQINRAVDFLRSVRLIPFLEIGFKPDKIQENTGKYVFFNDDEVKEIDIDDYEELMDHFMKHMINRYGVEDVGAWRFEMMCLSTHAQYGAAEIDNYIECFVRIRAVIKKYAPESLVGGPGFNLAFSEDLEKMAKITYTLRERNSPLDFFSIYAFSLSRVFSGGETVEHDRLKQWAKGETAEYINWAKTFIQSQDPLIRYFFVTEWSLDFSCRNILHDRLLKAAFVLQNCINAIGTTEVLAYWLASDISAEYSDSSAILFGGAGLISRHGIRKPSFFVYNFLSRLGSRLVAKGENYIITAKSDNSYTAIVFNFKYIKDYARLRHVFQDSPPEYPELLEDTKILLISLNLTGLIPGSYKIRQEILNHDHGSLYDAWVRLSAAEDLQTMEIEWLKNTCVPTMHLDFVSCGKGLSLDCELEPNEIRFLEISLILE
jgi:beta-xylosidase/AraC-like DNA-binding protein